MQILLLILIFILFFDVRIKVKKYKLSSSKITRSLKIAVVADFHSGKSKRLEKLIQNMELDMILIPGDLFDERREKKRVVDFLSAIQGKAPLVYVSGNHEWKKSALPYEEICDCLKQHGVIIADNTCIKLDYNIELIGIQDMRSYQTDYKQGEMLEKEVIKDLFKKVDKNTYHLVMIHRPDRYEQFEDFFVDLMISGHAHGGQVRIPYLINGLFAPQQGFFPKRAGGLYSLKTGVHVVSRGLSFFWWLPRIMNRPELVIIELEKNA